MQTHKTKSTAIDPNTPELEVNISARDERRLPHHTCPAGSF